MKTLFIFRSTLNTALLACFTAVLALGISAQSTVFTYQGHLATAGMPANSNYEMEFRLFDAASNGKQIGDTVPAPSVTVTNGIFSTNLDFGAAPFDNGPARYLQISVRTAGSPDPFTVLLPRQQLASTPYAIQAKNAATADNATNSLQLGGTPAKAFLQAVPLPLTLSGTSDTHVIQGENTSEAPGAEGISGRATGSNNNNYGVVGQSFGSSGSGVLGIGNVTGIRGFAQASLGITNGGTFESISSSGRGVLGIVSSISGGTIGVYGVSNSNAGIGVKGSGFDGGVFESTSSNGTGVSGFAAPNGIGVYGVASGASGTGVLAINSTPGGVALRTAGGSSWFSGDTTPLSASTVGSGTGIVIGSSLNSGYITAHAYAGSPGPRVLLINTTGGNVAIGGANALRTLHVNGRVRIDLAPPEPSVVGVCFTNQGDVVQCGGSSLRFKTNVRPFRTGLDIVRLLRPISFNLKDGGNEDIGLGAEDVAKVAPFFTLVSGSGQVEGVKYDRLNMLLINAVQEQQDLIESQRTKIGTLEQQLNAMSAYICAKDAGAGFCGNKK